MGQAPSRSASQPVCLVSSLKTRRSLAKKVELNDVSAVIADVQDLPQLLCSTISSGRSTLLHVVARLGSSSMLSSLLQLHATLRQPPRQLDSADEAAHQHSVHSSGADDKAIPGLHPGHSHHVCHVAHAGRKHHAASKQQVLPELQQLVNMQNSRKQTPLIIAASRGYADMVQQLLQVGADLFAADKAGCTALHYAAMYGHVDACRHICRHASALRWATASPPANPTPIMLSGGLNGSGLHSSGLISSGGGSGRHDRRNDGAATSNAALASSSSAPRLDRNTVTLLSRLLGIACHAGATALHFAADAGHADVVRVLCSHGADIHATMEPRQMHCVTLHSGATPLHLAAEQGHLSVALALLKHYQDSEGGTAWPSINDPRNAQDRAGLRPHQLAFLTHHFRVALVIRPNYPLSWLFDSNPNRSPAVPSLARLAAASLSVHLRNLLDNLEVQGIRTDIEEGFTSTRCCPASLQALAQSAAAVQPASTLQPAGIQPASALQGRNEHSDSSSASGSGSSCSSGSSSAAPSSACGAGGEPADVQQMLAAASADVRHEHSIHWHANICYQSGGLDQGGSIAETEVTDAAQLLPVTVGVHAAGQHVLQAVTGSSTDTATGVSIGSEITRQASSLTATQTATRTAAEGAGVAAGSCMDVNSLALCSWHSSQQDTGCSSQQDVGCSSQQDVGCSSTSCIDKDEAVCEVCFEDGSRLVQLQPCSHLLCMPCTRKLCTGLTTHPAACPFCRTPMANFQWA